MTQNLPNPSPEFSTNGNGYSNGNGNGSNGAKNGSTKNGDAKSSGSMQVAGLIPPPPPRFLSDSPAQSVVQPNPVSAADQSASQAAGQSAPQTTSAQQASQQSAQQSAQPIAPVPRIKNWRGSAVKVSLKTKATALALAIGTLPVIFIGGLAYQSASNALAQKVTESQLLATNEILDKVAFYMRERYGDIQIMSNLNVFTDARLRATSTAQEKQAALDQFIQAYPIYNSIAVFDLNGNVLAQSSGNPLDNHKSRNYFQTVLQTGKPVISDPQVSKSSGILSIHTAAPVKDSATGRVIGIVRARLPVSNLHELLATIVKTGAAQGNQAKEATEIYLTDRTGQVFSGSADGYETLKQPESAAALFPNLEALSKTNQSGVQVGSDKILSYVPMPKYQDSFRADLPALGWSAVATVDKDVALASERQLLLVLMTGTALAAVTVGALAAWLANRATRPLIEAANATQRIGQGDLQARLQISGDDEMGTLGRNINTMASRLQGILQEQEAATDKARFLAEVTARSHASNDGIDAVFDQALHKARQLLGVERMVIYRFYPNWSGYISNESVVTGFPRALDDKIEDPCIPQALLDAYRNGRVVPTHDVFNANFHPDHLKLMERLHIRANLVVPILNEGRLFGLLVAHHCTKTYEWRQADVDFMTLLATQLGVSISVQEVDTARKTAEVLAQEQTTLKENLQKRALELLMAVDPVSQGDLTVRAQVTEDEIGTVADSYNATIASLRKIVLQVQEAAEQVVSTTTTNETAVRDLSSGALQQTAEISAALERIQEMVGSIQAVAANAQQAESAVQQAAQTVQAGDAAMNRTVEGILAIRETVGETAKKVKRLGESSQKISKVVNLIGTFAAQTNLLALNASIEAARAGEEGRGFAVVADEVRSLARQSAEATAEIEKLVASIQAETNEVVAAMEAGTEQVVVGTQLVDETRQNLTQIAAVSTQINSLVNSIAQAAQMQSHASESVTKTMTDVAAIANQTSSEASQVSDSFKQLLDVAQSLQSEVSQFKVR
jgi:methyl-accepting chemotaxis protein PixJ